MRGWRLGGLLALVAALTGCGGRDWVRTSAAFVPNPVLLGPVERVGGAPVAGVKHDVNLVDVELWREDLKSDTYGIGTSTTTTYSSSARLTGASYELGLEILDSLVAPYRLLDPWQEPYRRSDMLRLSSFSVGARKSSNRGFGHSDSHETLSLTFDIGTTLVHLDGGPSPGPVESSSSPPPAASPPAEGAPVGELDAACRVSGDCAPGLVCVRNACSKGAR